MKENKKDKDLKTKKTNEKLDIMRTYIQDKEKCKIIAKQLTQYILNKD